MEKFPVFDIKKYFDSNDVERIEYGRKVDLICRETGFLAIKNHGISKHVIKNILDAVEGFFSLSQENKLNAKAPYEGYPYGYLGPGKEALAASRGIVTPPPT